MTVDAAGLCLKAGNAVLLRGSGSAARSNACLVELLRAALTSAGLPADAVQLLDASSRAQRDRADARPRPGRPGGPARRGRA